MPPSSEPTHVRASTAESADMGRANNACDLGFHCRRRRSALVRRFGPPCSCSNWLRGLRPAVLSPDTTTTTTTIATITPTAAWLLVHRNAVVVNFSTAIIGACLKRRFRPG
uniref:Uncharacterized protein n=1 Tax=Plectus sambesii TaxID=2011161 RepID=A0A914VXG4_9BILA